MWPQSSNAFRNSNEREGSMSGSFQQAGREQQQHERAEGGQRPSEHLKRLTAQRP